MAKWIILSLFVFTASAYVPPDAHTRSSSHGHSHGRAPHFGSFLPSYRSHSRSADPAPSFTSPIYRHKEYPLPRIYTLEKPLVDDAGIYRPLNIRRQESSSDFYRYDQEKDQYSTPNVLHADTKGAITRRAISIEINGQIFYYNDGFFYKESGKHLIVVAPVINSVVQKIPKGSANVGILGIHFEYNGIYFRKVPAGYQVVRLPMMI